MSRWGRYKMWERYTFFIFSCDGTYVTLIRPFCVLTSCGIFFLLLLGWIGVTGVIGHDCFGLDVLLSWEVL